eukprot:3056280-Rhodomonas_salina.2
MSFPAANCRGNFIEIEFECSLQLTATDRDCGAAAFHHSVASTGIQLSVIQAPGVSDSTMMGGGWSREGGSGAGGGRCVALRARRRLGGQLGGDLQC